MTTMIWSLFQQPFRLVSSAIIPLLLLLLLVCSCHGIPLMDESIETDRLAQHIVSHWHYDHLEPLASNRYNELASKLTQDHLEIHTRLEDDSDSDQVDAAVLQAQVLEGVHSYIQGMLLPSLWWDNVAQPLLSEKVLIALVRNVMEEYCPGDTVPATCLITHAPHITEEIDAGITAQLDLALAKLDTEVIPDVLAQTYALLERMGFGVDIKQPWVAGERDHQEAKVQCGSAHEFTWYLELARVQ